MKLRLGVVGTSFITHDFITACGETEKYQLTAIYSRKKSKAEEFGKHFLPQPDFYEDWEKFLAADLDVVYLASPNSVHYAQAKDCLLHGHHIIVEKPAFTNPFEMAEIIELASQKNCFYFEGARHIHEPGFLKLQENLPTLNEIVGVNWTYAKYSSRYDALLKGETVPNIFSLDFSGGALMDLGIYLVYGAVSLFGAPKRASYQFQPVISGVDGYGKMTLDYDGFSAYLFCGKNLDSFTPSEIYTTKGTISLKSITGITEITTWQREKKQTATVKIPLAENPMVYEAHDFAEIMLHPQDPRLGKRYEEWVELSRCVHDVLYELRKSSGLHFSADREKF